MACLTRGASQRVSRPDPQPTSRTRFPSSPSASSKARKRGESDTLFGLEVLGLGVMEDEGGYRGLRIHHESLGQPHPDLLGMEQVEEDALVGEVRAGRVAKGHAQTTI